MMFGTEIGGGGLEAGTLKPTAPAPIPAGEVCGFEKKKVLPQTTIYNVISVNYITFGQ